MKLFREEGLIFGNNDNDAFQSACFGCIGRSVVFFAPSTLEAHCHGSSMG